MVEPVAIRYAYTGAAQATKDRLCVKFVPESTSTYV